MDARKIVQKEFIAPFCKAGRKNIGVELEFPLLNLAKEPVDKNVAINLLEEMLTNGFKVAEYDADQNPAFIINADGDVLSFDNSYNNFEFSMEKCENLFEMSQRFYKLYEDVQNYLLPLGYSLCGIGANPFHPNLTSLPVGFPVYSLIKKFLGSFSGGAYHKYTDFPAYLSSVQTHLDVPIDKLPKALTLFADLDFVRALLFSNSPAFPDSEGFDETVCFRDYLWERSGFGSLRNNVGKVEGKFSTTKDIENLILSRSMFYRVSGDKYELIPETTVAEYFLRTDAKEEDINSYLSFQNVEITRRGTLEVRSDCAQPVRDAFCAPAFNLGILLAQDKARTLLDEFMQKSFPVEILNSDKRNKLLRDAVIYNYKLPADENATRTLLCDLISLAESSLKLRNKGEEKLLSCLYERAENLTCPAKEWKKALKFGTDYSDLIKKYASAE